MNRSITKLGMLFIILLLLINSKVFSDEPDEKLHTECLYPTVGIGSECGLYQKTFAKQDPTFGSGAIVRSVKVNDHYHNVVITCEHVINGRSEVKVRVGKYKNWSTFVKWEDYTATVYQEDSDLDLAVLLFVSKEKMPIAKINMKPKLYIGNNVFHIGAGLGDTPRIDFGKVTSVNAQISIMTNPGYRVNFFMVPGDSGGPVFNSKNQVVGFCQALRGHDRRLLCSFGYVIPTYRVGELLDVEFIHNHKKLIPLLPFYFLHAREYELSHFPGWDTKK